jgi:hypothetical protein
MVKLRKNVTTAERVVQEALKKPDSKLSRE